MFHSTQAINKLDSLMKVLVYIIIIFIAFSVFSVDTATFLAVSISVWAGLLFAVGGLMKNLVERYEYVVLTPSIIFLFGTHPYDVGGISFLY
jgi:hypothetical protein